MMSVCYTKYSERGKPGSEFRYELNGFFKQHRICLQISVHSDKPAEGYHMTLQIPSLL